MDALLALLGAYIEDEPQVVGEQVLFTRDQVANESGYVDRWSKSLLQLRRDLGLGNDRLRAVAWRLVEVALSAYQAEAIDLFRDCHAQGLLTVRAGLLVKVPEKAALVADGQGNPPEVVTGTFWLVNVTNDVGGGLVHGPVTVVCAPETAVHVDPRTLAVDLTPPAGTTSEPVGPVPDRQNCHGPLVLFEVTVAAKVNPLELTVHPEKVGLLTFPQTGTPEVVGPGTVPLVEDEVQVTVDVPSLKVTLDDEAVKLTPDGETVSASAIWAPRPSTAATKPRVMRFCVAFIAATPVGVGLPADATARRSRKAALSGCFVHKIF